MNDKTNLSDQTKFRLKEIRKIQSCFDSEINLRKLSSKKLSKYATVFDYIDKVLIVLKATSGGVYIISSVSFVVAPVGIAGTGFTLILSLITRIIKKLPNIRRNKKRSTIKFSCFLK